MKKGAVRKRGKVDGVEYKIVGTGGYADLLYMKCKRKFEIVDSVHPGVSHTALKQYARQHKRYCRRRV